MSDELAARLDRLIEDGVFPSRAAALVTAVKRLLADEERSSVDRAIVEGYTRMPATSSERILTRASGRRSIAAEPW